MKKKPRREHPMHSQGGSQDGAAATKIQRAVLVLSLGSRPFFKVTRPLIENFAARVSATLHVLSSVEHPALQPHMRRLKSTPRFLKLPALHYYLQRYNQVLFFDDDVVVSPRMADIFEAVEPALIGAVFERHKPQGWHSMHWRTACAIYNVSSCKPKSSCASPPRALTNFLPYCPVLPIPIDLLEWLHRDRPRPEDTPVVSPPAKHMR
mmetsp:Transcript_15900/g.33806  ORF Transcript_15900/g.33806 Transcript_15900/m.33806 type:complete len:208 (+) Transcript_15900:233-856(+)